MRCLSSITMRVFSVVFMQSRQAQLRQYTPAAQRRRVVWRSMQS